jgi:hypothetical protein
VQFETGVCIDGREEEPANSDGKKKAFVAQLWPLVFIVSLLVGTGSCIPEATLFSFRGTLSIRANTFRFSSSQQGPLSQVLANDLIHTSYIMLWLPQII